MSQELLIQRAIFYRPDLSPEIRGVCKGKWSHQCRGPSYNTTRSLTGSVASKSPVLSKVGFKSGRLRLSDCLSQAASTVGYGENGSPKDGSRKNIGHQKNRLLCNLSRVISE